MSAFVKKRPQPPPRPPFKNLSSLRVEGGGEGTKWNVLQVISRSAVVHLAKVHQRLGFTECQVLFLSFQIL